MPEPSEADPGPLSKWSGRLARARVVVVELLFLLTIALIAYRAGCGPSSSKLALTAYAGPGSSGSAGPSPVTQQAAELVLREIRLLEDAARTDRYSVTRRPGPVLVSDTIAPTRELKLEVGTIGLDLSKVSDLLQRGDPQEGSFGILVTEVQCSDPRSATPPACSKVEIFAPRSIPPTFPPVPPGQLAEAIRYSAAYLLGEVDPCAAALAPLVAWIAPDSTVVSAFARKGLAYRSAGRCLRQADSEDERAKALILNAKIHRYFDDTAGAERYLKRASLVSSQESRAQLELADLYTQARKSDLAEDAIGKALSATSNPGLRAQVQMTQALIQYSQQQFEKARSTLEGIVAREYDLRATLDRGTRSLIRFNLGNAIRDQATCSKGTLMDRAAALDSAIEHYQRAIEIDPSSAYAHNGIGRAFLELAEVAVRAQQSSTAPTTDPSHLWIAAREAFIEAAALDPSFTEPENNLGRALTALGRYEDAEIHFDKALANDPTFVWTHVDRVKSQLSARSGTCQQLSDDLAAVPPQARDHHWYEAAGRVSAEACSKLDTAKDQFANALSLAEKSACRDPWKIDDLRRLAEVRHPPFGSDVSSAR